MKQYLRADLYKVPLPQHNPSYTVVSHTKAVSIVEDCLKLCNLEVEREYFQLSTNGQIASGNLILKLDLGDEESECLVSFQNSYNKQKAFTTRAALRMKDSGNLIVLNRSSYRRVHKGTANEAIEENLCKTVQGLSKDFQELIDYKAFLKDIKLDQFDTFNMLGDMFFTEQILNSEQMNYIKEILSNKDPLKVYTYDFYKNTAFWMYMLASSALENRGNAIDAYTQSHTKLNEYFTNKFKQ